jgi:hypothetical protein
MHLTGRCHPHFKCRFLTGELRSQIVTRQKLADFAYFLNYPKDFLLAFLHTIAIDFIKRANMGALTINPIRLSAPMGAMLAFLGVKRCAPAYSRSAGMRLV